MTVAAQNKIRSRRTVMKTKLQVTAENKKS
jgi:hypothetical protein